MVFQAIERDLRSHAVKQSEDYILQKAFAFRAYGFFNGGFLASADARAWVDLLASNPDRSLCKAPMQDPTAEPGVLVT